MSQWAKTMWQKQVEWVKVSRLVVISERGAVMHSAAKVACMNVEATKETYCI